MSLTPLLRKIFFVDLLKGMSLTFRWQAPSEVITEQYPLERPIVAERYRGLPRLHVNPDTGETLCIACNLCALACPEKLITVKSDRDPNTKKKVLTSWTYDAGRCMFCGLCQEACPTNCLELSQDFEYATYSRDFVFDQARLEKGIEPTVYKK